MKLVVEHGATSSFEDHHPRWHYSSLRPRTSVLRTNGTTVQTVHRTYLKVTVWYQLRVVLYLSRTENATHSKGTTVTEGRIERDTDRDRETYVAILSCNENGSLAEYCINLSCRYSYAGILLSCTYTRGSRGIFITYVMLGNRSSLKSFWNKTHTEIWLY